MTKKLMCTIDRYGIFNPGKNSISNVVGVDLSTVTSYETVEEYQLGSNTGYVKTLTESDLLIEDGCLILKGYNVFASINEALNAIGDNATIFVEAGTYEEVLNRSAEGRGGKVRRLVWSCW